MSEMTPPADAPAFLAVHGWAGAAIAPLAGDASFRRYFRVTDGARRAVLMDAPPPHEDPRPFLAVGKWLSDRQFRSPAILAADVERGLILIEDFGDDRMREAADLSVDAQLPLYTAAVDVLIALRSHPAGPFAPYDHAVLARETALFVEWYGPAVGIDADREAYLAAWDQVFDHALTPDPVTVLRDYHAENLMLVGPERAMALLDFQDALAGHPAYDLVSLLQDARREVDPGIEQAMIAHYRSATGAGEDFMDAYHVLGAQRNAKILGIFTRLWKRDGKPRYAALCPRVWAYLERDLSHPVLAPVAAWFDAHVPPEQRGDPAMLAA